MADFEQINKARKILDLKEEATLDEIKNNYRKLALKYHPDKCKEEDRKKCEEKFKEITHANDILMRYCGGYRYSFKKKDVKRNTLDKKVYDYLRRFYYDEFMS
jgi:preprotein translocase subunit Sec63